MLPIKLRIFQVLLFVFPLFFLAQKGWVSTIHTILFFYSLYLIFSDKEKLIIEDKYKKLLILIFIILSLPIFAVFLSQLLRNDWVLKDYDSSIRFLISIPIFIAIIKIKFYSNKFFLLSIGLAILFNGLYGLMFPYERYFPRLATYFNDPLTFGSMMLTLGLLVFSMIEFNKNIFSFVNFIKIILFIFAIYLSIKSQSRSGWLALPLILMLIIIIHTHQLGLMKKLFIIFSPIFLVVFLYFSNHIIYQRVNDTFNDLKVYDWNSTRNLTSIGERLDFYRLAWLLFLKRPFSGWGENGFLQIADTPDLNNQFTNQLIIDASNNDFHNEIVSNTIHSGIFGGLAAIFLLLLPIGIYSYYLKKNISFRRIECLMGITLHTCLFITSLSTEIFNLKFSSSFYSVLIVIIFSHLYLSLKKYAK